MGICIFERAVQEMEVIATDVLYACPPLQDEPVNMDVIFVHGLTVFEADKRDMWRSCWTTSAGDFWPLSLLRSEFSAARFLFLGWESTASGSEQSPNFTRVRTCNPTLLAEMGKLGKVTSND